MPQADRYREALNDAQYEAVDWLDGPCLVVAGAGSGKTRTLVYRVARLVARGVMPENILLLTFTRKAAQQMINRASLLLDESCRAITGGTFHAVANMMLRRYSRYAGFVANFTILDQADAEDIINILKSSLNLSGAGNRFPSKRTILSLFSRSVNRAVPVQELLFGDYIHLAEHGEELVTLSGHYAEFKRDHQLMDYDDLLVHWKTVLDQERGVREEMAERFSYIMVDEYQDTNPLQAAIVRLMANGHANVMAVGDDSQSIYSFRGADFRNILEFPRLFPGTRIIKLEENFRSTQPILSTANAIIAQAKEKYTKILHARRGDGDRPVLYGAKDEADQARFIAGHIVAQQEKGTALHDMAVLFRAGFHSYQLEIELNSKNIPFEKRGGLKLTEAAHIKDVIAHLRLVANPEDYLSWNRILLLLEKVGPKTAALIRETVRKAQDPVAALAEYPAKPAIKSGLNDLYEVMTELCEADLAPATLVGRLLVYYEPILERVYHDDYPRRSRDLEQLQVLAHEYRSLTSFLDDLVLDPLTPGTEGAKDQDRLVLSTIHSAKGLEWETVFVMHLAEGFFPPVHALYSEDDLEEERRLLYVAVTRAKNLLYLTYPRRIFSSDGSSRPTELSGFLAGLSPGLFTSLNLDKNRFPAPPKKTTPFRQGMETGGMSPGLQVMHPYFGPGTVLAIKGPRTVEIFFPRHGKKNIHLDYGRLEIIAP